MSSNLHICRDGISEQNGDDVRERLLRAARILFARKGFESTNVREIVDVANVTRPTLYYYFQSKEGLYLRLLERLCKTVEDSMLSAIVSVGSARARLRSFVEHILDSVIEDASSQRHFFTIVLDPRRIIVSSYHERMRNFIASILEVLLEDGVAGGEFEIEDVGHARKAISAYIASFIHNEIFIPDPTTNRDETVCLLDKLLDQIESSVAPRGGHTW